MPRTPAMITGIVIGYSRIGSSTSRLRARTSIAANSVPTAANPSVPAASRAPSGQRMREQRRLEHQRHERDDDRLDRREQQQHAGQLADIERRPIERAPACSARSVSFCRSRSNVRPSASVPENAIAIHRMPAAASSTASPPARTRTRTPARTRRRRRASCRGPRGCGLR